MQSNDILDMIIKILGTSIPGYVAYYTLYKMNILNIQKNRPEENRTILAMLSLINVFIGLQLLQNSNSESFFANVLFVTFVLLIVSTILIPFFAGPFVKYAYKLLNLLRKKEGYGDVTPLPIYKEVFDHPNGTRLSIFDFSGSHIISGTAESAPENNEFDYFAFKFSSKIEDYGDISETEIIKMYQAAQVEHMGTYSVYVDLEKKIKIHVFVEN